jgi:hypothetical protein
MREPTMILCVGMAHLPGQVMHHTALAFTNMHLEKHFCIPDYLPARFGTKSTSNVHVTMSQNFYVSFSTTSMRTKYPKT